MADSVEFKGVDKMIARLAEIEDRAIDNAGKALYQKGLVIRAAAVRITPKDTGALRDSFEVSRPKKVRGDIEVAITVGGPSAPYAIYVHENTQASHPVGQAKYLEDPVMAAAGHIAAEIGKSLLDG